MIIIRNTQELARLESDTIPAEIFKELLFDAYQVERQFCYFNGQPRKMEGVYVLESKADEAAIEEKYRLSEQEPDFEDATEADGNYWEKHVYTIDGITVIVYWNPNY